MCPIQRVSTENSPKQEVANLTIPIVSDIVLGRLPEKLREPVVDVLQEFQASSAQKRASLQRKGLSKATIDELEWLYEDCE